MDFDYKKYSLEKLEEWVHDAMSSDASPHEIYSTIREVVRENYYYHKEHTSRAYGLLELLSGHRPVEDKELLETVLSEREYYEGPKDDGMRPWGHSDIEYGIANHKKPLTCDKDDPSPECQKSWNDFWEDVDEKNSREYNLREAEYYNKRAELDSITEQVKSAGGYDWTPLVEGEKSKYYYEYDRNDSNRKNPFKDKVVRWQLPIESDGASGEYFVQFPDDLLDATNLKEGDQVEWVDKGDGSYLLRKV